MGIRDLFNKFNKKSDDVNKELDMYDKNLSKESEDLDKISFIIDTVKHDLTNGKSDKVGIVELSTKLDMISKRKSGKRKKKINLSNIINNPNKLSLANNMMLLEKERIYRYDEYEMIAKFIPQLDESVRTYVDNILSPDDFTKISLEKDYGADNINKITKNQLFDRLDNLIDEYQLEELIRKNVEQAVKLGDSFTVVKKISEELSRVYNSKNLNMINENVESYLNTSKIFVETEDLFLEDEFDEMLNDEINEINSKMLKQHDKKIIRDDYIRIVNRAIKDNVTITDDSDILFSDITNMNEEVKKRNNKLERTSDFVTHNSKYKKREIDKEVSFDDIDGSIVKFLDPRNVVKIESDGYVYGYYYIDTYGTERPTSNRIQSAVNKSGYLQGDASSIILNSLYNTNQFKMEKKRFVYEIFAQKLISNIDDKFIRKNKQFKEIILNVLDQHNILSSGRNMRIVFIKPQDMIHYQTGGDVYGVSIFEPILFLAKIYLSVLISNLMLKITRGTDKRVFYVEIGVENDNEEEVQSVIRDITQREVALNDLLDLDYIMNIQGANDDYVIPVYDGNRPIEFDMLDKQDVDIENDFLDFLHKKIQAGVGIPASFIESIEDVQLATTLTMIHEKFMRRVITCQKYYQPANNKLIQVLYNNEYQNVNKITMRKLRKELKDSKDSYVIDDISNVIVNKIYLKFPSPSTLNFTNMDEQLNRAEGIINKILDIMIPIDDNGSYSDSNTDDNEAKKELRNKFRLELYKKYVSNVKWVELEEMLDILKIESATETIKNKPIGSNDTIDNDNSSDDNDFKF